MPAEKLHFMGILGSGASGAACIAAARGYDVTGSDQAEDSEYALPLRERHIPISHGFADIDLAQIDTLVYTPAVIESGEGKPIIERAKDKGIETVTWQRFVGHHLLKDKFVIGITGTNGKSTTTALVGLLLEAAGADPTVLLGAKVPTWQANFRFGVGKHFVIEADEAYESFLNYSVDIGVITNIEMDHPEYYPDPSSYRAAFDKFAAYSSLNSTFILGRSVGNFHNPNGSVTHLDALLHFNLNIPGEFNQENASLAAMVGVQVGLDEGLIRQVCENFTGIGRRFEFRGQMGKTQIYDDFAHHPDAIEKTLKATVAKFPEKKIWVVFQPHLYSRTKALYADFITSLQQFPVAKVILVPVYAAREKDDLGVSMPAMAKAIGQQAQFIADKDDLTKLLRAQSAKIDVLLFLGAGTINRIIPDLVDAPKSAS